VVGEGSGLVELLERRMTATLPAWKMKFPVVFYYVQKYLYIKDSRGFLKFK
jgi:hypothetical protein